MASIFRLKNIQTKKHIKRVIKIKLSVFLKYYSKYKIIRIVVLYGGTENKVVEIEVGFLLNENGDLVLGVKAPELFKEAIKNLLDFWQ